LRESPSEKISRSRSRAGYPDNPRTCSNSPRPQPFAAPLPPSCRTNYVQAKPRILPHGWRYIFRVESKGFLRRDVPRPISASRQHHRQRGCTLRQQNSEITAGTCEFSRKIAASRGTKPVPIVLPEKPIMGELRPGPSDCDEGPPLFSPASWWGEDVNACRRMLDGDGSLIARNANRKVGPPCGPERKDSEKRSTTVLPYYRGVFAALSKTYKSGGSMNECRRAEAVMKAVLAASSSFTVWPHFFS